MKRTVLLILALSLGLGAAWADSDMIATRRALMKQDGVTSKQLFDMLKGNAAFDLPTVQKALATYQDIAAKAPGMFPPDSKTGATNASPAIWDNLADFNAQFAQFGADAKDAAAAITDEASFKANIPKVFAHCGGCHEKYKLKT